MSRYSNDFLASAVVFLVALPLCMGISIASGVPPALGLITGIVGGIVVGSLSGSPLQVSGPAAGLTVLVVDIVRDHGIAALGPIILLAGILQIVAGRLHVGGWFRAMSPSVVYGMLAGIGIIIFSGQFHVMLDDKPKGSGLDNLLSIPSAIFSGIFPIDGSKHEMAALLGLITIVTLICWEKFKRGYLKLIPGALAGVVVASTLVAVFRLPVQLVDVPGSLLDVLQFPSVDSLRSLIDVRVLFSAAALAFIASAETLLSANAVDRMQTIVRTDYDKELAAQGVGNLICGALGVLPMTGVIVRSSANVQAGARTRLSAILHGVWLLAFISMLPGILRLIPTASLGAILVYTGYKLVNPKAIRNIAAYGRFPLVIYAATVITIVATDLLTGVITGVVLSVIKIVYKMSHLDVLVNSGGARTDVELVGAATFVGMPKLATALEAIPRGSEVHLGVQRLAYIDHACLDLIKEWASQHEKTGGAFHVEWEGLLSRSAPMHRSPALMPG